MAPIAQPTTVSNGHGNAGYDGPRRRFESLEAFLKIWGNVEHENYMRDHAPERPEYDEWMHEHALGAYLLYTTLHVWDEESSDVSPAVTPFSC